MLPSTKEYAIGALLILLVDVLWTGSNYISNTVLTHGYETNIPLLDSLVKFIHQPTNVKALINRHARVFFFHGAPKD